MQAHISEKVRLLSLRGVSTEQLRDIKFRLSESGVIFEEDPPTSPIQRYLYVARHDASRARAIVRSEIADYAAARRAEWEKEWSQKYGGSYFRWLKHQLFLRPKEAAFRFFNLM